MDPDKTCKHGVSEHQDSSRSEETRAKRDGDWILELFAPSNENPASEALKLKEQHELREEIPKIKVVSAFDPQSIKNVYERVHEMLKLDQELKSEKSHRTVNESATKTATQRVSATDVGNESNVDIVDSSLWNSEELSVLRGVFRAARGQISGLEVRLRQFQRRNEELEEKQTAVSQALDNKTKKLSEATKANHRLKIHCDELLMDQKAMAMKLKAVTEMWQEIDGEKLRMMKETQEMRIALDRERIARQQLEMQFHEVQQQADAEIRMAEQTAQAHCDQQLVRMEDHITRLEDELAAEREMHARDKKALDHLRTHFASLPLHDVMPAGAVFEDQVFHIDHVS